MTLKVKISDNYIPAVAVDKRHETTVKLLSFRISSTMHFTSKIPFYIVLTIKFLSQNNNTEMDQ